MIAGTILLAAVGMGLVAVFWIFQPLGDLQHRISDILLVRESGTPQDIVIAEIDDQTLTTLERSTNQRVLHAQAIANLKAAGARVILYDLLFFDPSPDDQQLADAMKAAGNVVLPVAGVQALGTTGGDRHVFQTILEPPEPLRSAAQSLGHVNFPPDGDGVVRRVPLFIRDAEGNGYASILVSAIYAQTVSKPPKYIAPVEGKVAIPGQLVPVDDSGAMRPHWSSRLDQFEKRSYGDAIAGRLTAGSLQGKTVIVGLTAQGVGDVQLIPLSGTPEPGVAIWGNVLDSLFQGVFVREASATLTALSLLPLVAVTMYAVPRFNLRVAALVLILIAIASYFLAFGLFNSDQKLVMNFVYPGLLLPGLYLIGLAHRVTAQRADSRELSDLFGRYASPEVMHQLADAADRGELNLGGTLREITVLFADLRGFTGVSERLPPDEVVMFLNEAFGIMIRAISRNDGIVNKFGGDMVMGIWNAPNDVDDHAIKACRSAVEALAEMAARNLAIADDPDAKFGFGINSGEAVAGNVGSAGRLEYSVIGDPVNVGSRLCGIAGGGEIYIGDRTREMAGSRVEVEPLGPQVLKGRSRPVEAYKVLSVDGAMPVPDAAMAVH